MLPAWLMAIAAIVVASIASSYFGGTRFLINPLCAVTVILLGASSFGSEFQYKTMPMLLSQPLNRSELWYSKMVILGPAHCPCRRLLPQSRRTPTEVTWSSSSIVWQLRQWCSDLPLG